MSKVFLHARFVLFISAVVCLEVSKPEHYERKPGYCNVEGIYIKEGKTIFVPTSQCQKLTCDNAEDNSISFLSCPEIRLNAGCHVTQEDVTATYPTCCPRLVCNAEEDSEYDSESIEARSGDFFDVRLSF